jgi:two-component system osmolarity sensor histidine kinase EnvZ
MLDDKGDTELRAGIEQDINDIDVAINQFLDFARAASSEAASPEADLNALINDLIARYQRAASPVTFDAHDVPPLPLRALAIQRLVGNLIDNALRYGNTTDVNVVTGHDTQHAYVEVLDRGPGIPPADAERMLEPFTRMDTARSTSGTGLGLAIVDRIARLHGGCIKLLPREGGGLRARVELALR